MKEIVIKKNRYVDSVSLMGISDRVMALEGVTNVEVQMATRANREILEELGYELPEAVTANDLVIAVTAENETVWRAALEMAEAIMDRKFTDHTKSVGSLEEIDMEKEPCDLCQISLPGEYAAEQAEKALRMGMDVFMFSDNVPLSQELKLKKLGASLGRLVMGPDAGVSLVDGIALAAGSITAPGPIGIVGASGSGAQEIGCIIERCGLGVSGIIGTGGRDLYPEIGGITMMEGIRRMEEDSDTKVIVLVSKLADLAVMDRVLSAADVCRKPVVAVFLGSDRALFEGHRVSAAFSLEEAALKALSLAGVSVPSFGFTEKEIEGMAQEAVAKLGPEQRFFRGLYCGGTFTEEALQYFSVHNKETALHSNLSNEYCRKLADPLKSVGHTILDLGAEDFTARAPHPVFDPGLRLGRLRQELEDPQVGVILLDFITGPGVAADPVGPFVKACREVREKRGDQIVFIANICGSREDPQNIAEKEEMLRKAGVIVTASNYQSARLAGAMMHALDGRNQG